MEGTLRWLNSKKILAFTDPIKVRTKLSRMSQIIFDKDLEKFLSSNSIAMTRTLRDQENRVVYLSLVK